MAKKQIPVGFEQKEEFIIRTLANRKNCSIADIIRKIIQEYISTNNLEEKIKNLQEQS